MLAIKYGATAPDRIDLVTTGATVQVDWSCTQVDKLIADTNPTSAFTIPNNGQVAAGTQKITTDPALLHEAMVREISAVNTHATASCTVQLQHTINGGTARKLTNAYTLLAGEKLLVNADGTLFLYDASGNLKESVAAPFSVTVLTSGTAAAYTPPAGCRAIRVRLVGGGGAGGGSSTAATSGGGGGGGGGGGYTEKLISVPAASYTYTVGGGGAAGSAGANAGGNGSDTTFGSLTAKGATGGGGATAAAATRALGGAGGVAGSGGDLNAPGQPGGHGINVTAALVASGSGGSTPLGGGALGVSAQGAGAAAVANTGGGGSGGAMVSAGAAVAGGVGGSGVIVVEEFY